MKCWWQWFFLLLWQTHAQENQTLVFLLVGYCILSKWYSKFWNCFMFWEWKHQYHCITEQLTSNLFSLCFFFFWLKGQIPFTLLLTKDTCIICQYNTQWIFHCVLITLRSALASSACYIFGYVALITHIHTLAWSKGTKLSWLWNSYFLLIAFVVTKFFVCLNFRYFSLFMMKLLKQPGFCVSHVTIQNVSFLFFPIS